MSKYTKLKDIKGNMLYIDDIVEFVRNNVKNKGIIIDKSHQYTGIYFIQPLYNKPYQLVVLNEHYIPIFQVTKVKK